MASLANRIDSYLASLNQAGYSGVVLVAQPEAVLHLGGYGYAQRKEEIRFTSETIFDTGSVTKHFTSCAILRLVDGGQLSLNDSLAKFLPAAPADKARITLHELLTHTGRLRSRTLWHSIFGDFKPVSRERFLLRALRSRMRRPASAFSYSDLGYGILAAVCEMVSGLRYEQFLLHRFFHQAGMGSTGYVLPMWDLSLVAHNYASGRDRGNNLGRIIRLDPHFWNLMGNGGIHSTVRDLFRWWQALERDQLVSADLRKRSVQGYVDVAPGMHYGYGNMIRNLEPVGRSFGHSGSDGAFSTSFRWLEKDPLLTIVHSNSSAFKSWDIADELLSLSRA